MVKKTILDLEFLRLHCKVANLAPPGDDIYVAI